jgi:hypothetical protein
MLEEQLDQAAFAGSEMPVHPAARQAMEHRHGLLGEQLFEFVGRHSDAVARESLFVNRYS